jgi:ribosomal protein L11 methyltransferase
MPWLSVILETNAAYAENLSDALLEAGALSVSAEDADAGTPAEEAQFGEPGSDDRARWTRSLLRMLCRPDDDIATLVATASAAVELSPPPSYRTEVIDDEDWVRRTHAQFQPVQVSARLWVVPSWHNPPDPAAINIHIDPGLAFGTGTHPTTRLCMQWLEAKIAGGERVLDYGCGSGILAIAAMKLGAGSVLGIDIDAEAISTAQFNGARNQVAASFCTADTVLTIEADIVVANILANPLVLLAPALARHTCTGGHIVLSGILVSQAAEVIAAYRPAFELAPFATDDGWVCLTGVKRA